MAVVVAVGRDGGDERLAPRVAAYAYAYAFTVVMLEVFLIGGWLVQVYRGNGVGHGSL